ncbi:hypothetical protein IPC88_07450 [Pseudomonas aeruginosa]|nr:hypothetical protein SCVFeb_2306 [Pseudomonas aeruginosa]CRZ29834.1 hypothetical protein PADK1_02281 [Pseudomonas aeruginosa DK1]APJ46702.1 hypothetical protein SCVJan_2306 [Pseudomonas aeruginosa]APJ53234.1 hypothetical protein NHmuc_3237 [Pseudomonas aeruginosa]MBG6666034.1 hypothetical protein [Pseudomonas aeruginosa]
MINVESVKKLVGSAYHLHARNAFGEEGVQGVNDLLNSVRMLYQRCPPECLKGQLTIFLGLQGITPLAPAISAFGSPISVSEYADFAPLILNVDDGVEILIEIVSDGTFKLLVIREDFDLSFLAQRGLVYRFESGTERILAKEFSAFVPKVSNILLSNFSEPTLANLDEALKRYAKEMVLESQCRILRDVWEGGVDGPRLVLVNKPESLMRDSLCHALSLLLRDVSVRPEQNTDETKPVDIRVEWFGSGASALIEVKWLGKARAKPKAGQGEETFTEYSRGRAQEGSRQLADYLDRQVRHSSSTAPRGYLVVFDARRRHVKGANDCLPKEDAFWYESDEIEYNPDYSKVRSDFETPIRFYMRPRASNLSL